MRHFHLRTVWRRTLAVGITAGSLVGGVALGQIGGIGVGGIGGGGGSGGIGVGPSVGRRGGPSVGPTNIGPGINRTVPNTNRVLPNNINPNGVINNTVPNTVNRVQNGVGGATNNLNTGVVQDPSFNVNRPGALGVTLSRAGDPL